MNDGIEINRTRNGKTDEIIMCSDPCSNPIYKKYLTEEEMLFIRLYLADTFSGNFDYNRHNRFDSIMNKIPRKELDNSEMLEYKENKREENRTKKRRYIKLSPNISDFPIFEEFNTEITESIYTKNIVLANGEKQIQVIVRRRNRSLGLGEFNVYNHICGLIKDISDEKIYFSISESFKIMGLERSDINNKWFVDKLFNCSFTPIMLKNKLISKDKGYISESKANLFEGYCIVGDKGYVNILNRGNDEFPQLKYCLSKKAAKLYNILTMQEIVDREMVNQKI